MRSRIGDLTSAQRDRVTCGVKRADRGRWEPGGAKLVDTSLGARRGHAQQQAAASLGVARERSEQFAIAVVGRLRKKRRAIGPRSIGRDMRAIRLAAGGADLRAKMMFCVEQD